MLLMQSFSKDLHTNVPNSKFNVFVNNRIEFMELVVIFRSNYFF